MLKKRRRRGMTNDLMKKVINLRVPDPGSVFSLPWLFHNLARP